MPFLTRKKHTARRVASTPSVVLTRGEGGTPSQVQIQMGVPHPRFGSRQGVPHLRFRWGRGYSIPGQGTPSRSRLGVPIPNWVPPSRPGQSTPTCPDLVGYPHIQTWPGYPLSGPGRGTFPSGPSQGPLSEPGWATPHPDLAGVPVSGPGQGTPIQTWLGYPHLDLVRVSPIWT